MKIFSQSTACALIAVANVSASANSSASANASASAHSSATAESSASATSSATANAIGGFNAPTWVNYRPTVNHQPLKPCTTQYNSLIKFQTGIFTTVDLPDCDADGYYKAIQCDQSYCWCSSREGIEVAGTRQSKFNVRSRLTCSQTWYPKTPNGCSRCQTFTVDDTPGKV